MNRWTPLHRRSALAVLAAMAVTTLSRAQTGTAPQAFPVKPITLLVPFGPGGIADITARAVAQSMGRTSRPRCGGGDPPDAGRPVGSDGAAAAGHGGRPLGREGDGGVAGVWGG